MATLLMEYSMVANFFSLYCPAQAFKRIRQ